MVRPTLNDMTPVIDRNCADVLGDTVRYAADGTLFESAQAFVDYRDADKAFDAGQVISQDIAVSGMLKADVPTKPSGIGLITFARLPGLIFKPINARSDRSGTGWDFEVKQVV